MFTRPEPSVLVRMTRSSSPSARHCAGRSSVQVVEPDIRKVAEPLLDLPQNASRGRQAAEEFRPAK